MTQAGMIGAITYHRVVETEGPEFAVGFLLPDATPEALAPHRSWLVPRLLDPATDRLVMAVQSYVLRTAHHTILIDSCVGNDKERRFHKPWSRRASRAYLERLAAIGLSPGDIDFVLCTHLHADHVAGTRCWSMGGGRRPSPGRAMCLRAPNSTIGWRSTGRGRSSPTAALSDSVLPVLEAGQADIVDDDYAFDDEVWFEPDRAGTRRATSQIHLASQGRRRRCPAISATPRCNAANRAGVRSAAPTPARSAATRLAFLEAHCETATMVMTAHFPSPSVGWIRRRGEAFDFVP